MSVRAIEEVLGQPQQDTIDLLRDALKQDYARRHGIARKMAAIEIQIDWKRVVRYDVALGHLEDLVHEAEGLPLGEQIQDLVRKKSGARHSPSLPPRECREGHG